ncbi:adenine deaminase [Echinicola sp. CAU 1574]|uniref:Adenine deaminase n=1 Tax=Echinicola arenosa TaxID=2774144 RepID=A0ABR9AGS1_9BACT|nr:adenine deaminase [Echinicola arenosa]MBD8487936.1 adenine deaminase [Echinicola arenosa]
MNTFFIDGQLVDVINKTIVNNRITIKDGLISAINPIESAPKQYILPGFIDAHVHVESSMLIPSEFARLASVHGTVATVSDPHEIANVCGKEGVEYMIENGKQINFKFYFGAPSCVPATPFETAGGEISLEDLEDLLSRPEVSYLAEMMNWPGTVNRDPEVMKKIAIAQKFGKPVDGHAPGLKGEMAKKYITAGISTDHECFTAEEALDKLQYGMKIAIREGSAAKNFDALIDLIDDYYDKIMFCSDDKHPDNLAEGHINKLVSRAVKIGKDLFKVLQVACINPIEHYQMDVGKLQVGDKADFIISKDLVAFDIIATYVNGKKIAENGQTLMPSIPSNLINNFNTSPKSPADFEIQAKGDSVKVIVAQDGQLITPQAAGKIKIKEGLAESNIEEDILKISVINRYEDQSPAISFIKNFGLKEGAIASSVGHDSHNILAVGVDNTSIAKAVNLIIEAKGGISAVSKTEDFLLPLPIGGIMSNENGYDIATAYTKIDLMAKKMGSTLNSPFMTLSFMALLVIPELKLSDQGLFDGLKFEFSPLFLE